MRYTKWHLSDFNVHGLQRRPRRSAGAGSERSPSTQSRGVCGALNADLGAVPPVSETAVCRNSRFPIRILSDFRKKNTQMTRPPGPRQVYSITVQIKALASHVGEDNLGPCRLLLTSTSAELVPKLLPRHRRRPLAPLRAGAA
jgi:hypothetical protein